MYKEPIFKSDYILTRWNTTGQTSYSIVCDGWKNEEELWGRTRLWGGRTQHQSMGGQSSSIISHHLSSILYASIMYEILLPGCMGCIDILCVSDNTSSIGVQRNVCSVLLPMGSSTPLIISLPIMYYITMNMG